MKEPSVTRWLTPALKNLSPEERAELKAQGGENPFYLAELYHQNSKLRPDLFNLHTVYSKPDFRGEGRQYQQVPEFSDLPPLEVPLGTALRTRRSSWEFGEAMSQEQLWMLLKYAVGTTKTTLDDQDDTQVMSRVRFRSYPSGGALYPIQFYMYLNRVEGVPAGLYRYCPYHNHLFQIAEGEHFLDSVNRVVPATDPDKNPLWSREDFSQAAAFLFLAADFRHQADKYRLLGYRLTMFETGHAAQNLCLVSTALGLSVVTLGGFYEDRANELFGLDGVDRSVIYILPIGKKSEGS
ncbi:SagB family peptide dehydrogenase [Tumebacillus sp. ITR2]|uniref:SagB family peptide dehydrogenase n=1 Tax=Tumebacillus amylolyticus TaxID=2801339 RepID=A0ABS1J9L7_9BACL|nr:SagB family peptide dehydrogenase [Tumebacillus amylolyticus]MBL0386964.1 SagB family peptide dehydrogenase [Tumebacillus amylolyticus]